MIRVIAIASLMVLLIVVLYLPAAVTPKRFIAQVLAEHQLQAEFWGPLQADRMLARTLAMSEAIRNVEPFPSADTASRADAMGQTVGREMERLTQRLFDSAYLRGVEALTCLGIYRLQAIGPWIPLEGSVGLAMLVDGLLARTRRAREFKPHDPELFAVHATLLVLLGCVCVIASVVPLTLSPLIVGLPVPLACALCSGLLSNFHKGIG